MRMPCGVCDEEHTDVDAFVEAHPSEAANIRERVAFVSSPMPDEDSDAVPAIVAFLGRLEAAGYEVRRLRAE